jgi:tripartite-type tricarboxylate transporter receptor subunit TctC
MADGGWRWLARVVLALLVFSSVAYAQDASKRPLRLLVPSPPGGPSDFAGRLVASGIGEALGRPVVVDARQSVNGILSMETAARAAPDGNSLSIGNVGTHVMNTGLYKNLPYDPVKDFVPVGRLVSAGTALVATMKFPPRTFKDFVAAAKSEPGKYNVGVAGANGQVATEVLKYFAGIKLNNIPYKGSSPTEVAIMSGEIEVALLSIPVVAPQVKAGRMKVFGVTTAMRSAMMPDVPTIQEQGLEGYEFGNWHALFAPAGTSDAYVRKLNKIAVEILQKPEIRDVVAKRGNEIIAGSPDELAGVLKRDIPRYRKIMAQAGIQPQ